jgi:glycerol uptake facilitator-like aquaporin
VTEATYSFGRRLVAEGLGAALLLAVVIGSGIMGERLSGGNVALALLANALATGCGLFVLILAFGPVSGAHFNPAVTLVFAVRGELARTEAVSYVAVQAIGAVAGVIAAHMMFSEPVLSLSHHVRQGPAQWWSEAVATFGLVGTILAVRAQGGARVAAAVAAYITAAYWFTASTSFANPAVTLARCLSDTFAGIRPSDVPGFILGQAAGATAAALLFGWLLDPAERQERR